jgi:hypothetical protein
MEFCACVACYWTCLGIESLPVRAFLFMLLEMSGSSVQSSPCLLSTCGLFFYSF